MPPYDLGILLFCFICQQRIMCMRNYETAQLWTPEISLVYAMPLDYYTVFVCIRRSPHSPSAVPNCMLTLYDAGPLAYRCLRFEIYARSPATVAGNPNAFKRESLIAERLYVLEARCVCQWPIFFPSYVPPDIDPQGALVQARRPRAICMHTYSFFSFLPGHSTPLCIHLFTR